MSGPIARASSLAIGLCIVGCADPCPKTTCKPSLTVTVRNVIGSLVPKNAYEALVCIQGNCVEATFALPPDTGSCDPAFVGDGSLCCQTTWPKQTASDCRRVGNDLELTLPLPNEPLPDGPPSEKAEAVVLTVIDSEGDESLRDETLELPRPDPACSSAPCRSLLVF